MQSADLAREMYGLVELDLMHGEAEAIIARLLAKNKTKKLLSL